MPTEQIDSPIPRTKKTKRTKGPQYGTRCLNCSKEPLTTAFCPDCGQENISFAVTLPLLLKDLLDEFLKFDGRLFQTLGALLLVPGKFTMQYNAGRRVHYLSPFKLYLIVSAIFFFFVAREAPTRDFEREIRHGMHIGAKESSDFSIHVAPSKEISVSKEEPAADPKSAKTENIRETKKQKNTSDKPEIATAAPDTFALPSLNGKRMLPKGYTFEGQAARPGNLEDAYEAWQKDPKNTEKHTGLERFAGRQMMRFIDHPGGLVDSYIESLAKAMFFTVPLYGLLLAVLFRGTRRYYVEHLVFAINQHTLAFLFGVVVELAPNRNVWWFVGYFLLYWIYEFVSLRRVYKQSWGLTLFKQLMLNHVYPLVLALVMGLVLLVSFFLM